MGQKQTAVTGKNSIMIHGPKTDGSYLVDSGPPTARCSRSACSLERPRVLKHFQDLWAIRAGRFIDP
jgi:hypothetical protein